MAEAEKTLRTLIDKIAVENGAKNYDITIKPITSGGANYTSKLFLIIVAGEKDELKLFAKVAFMSEKLREFTTINVFDTERFFYTTLLKKYRDIEERHDVPVEHRISVPKFYGYNSDYLEETIILEDLVHEGYAVYDRTKSMDWAYASKAVEEIAKLHALSFAFEIENPDEFNDILQRLKFGELSDEQQKVVFENSFKSALEFAKDEHKEKLMKYVNNIKLNFMGHMTALKKPVLCHGDYRVSNQMYKTTEDGSITIKMMDFQMMQGGCAIGDLMFLIFTGTDEEFRRLYYHKLMDHYYEQLCVALKRLNLNPDDVYSRTDYEQELSAKLPSGLLVAIFTLPIITVEADEAPVMDDNTDFTSFAANKLSDLYPERIRGVINDYVRWGVI